MADSTPGLQAAPTKALRAALAVAERGSTAAAARVLHVSPSSIARAIAALEASLGVPLFDRGSHGMSPTLAGHRVAARVRAAFAHLRRADAGPWRLAATRSRIEAQASTRQLEVLLSLAIHGSERRAAEALGLSQPAIHQALRRLEHLAGEPLFERLAIGLRLTARGEWTLREVKLALAQLRAGSEELQELQQRRGGQLAIGILPYSAALIIPQALRELGEQDAPDAPDAPDVRVVDGLYAALVSQLLSADIDILVGALRREAPAGTRQVHLFDDPLAVVARAGHPLAQRRRLSLRQAREQAWILPMPGAPARIALEQVFAAEGLAPPPGIEINSPTLMQAMLLGGDYLALMSRRQLAHEVRAGLLAFLPIRVSHAPRPVGYTVRDGFVPSPLLRRFIASLERARG
jgi:LysR family transcriptional regulator of gallate degradation